MIDEQTYKSIWRQLFLRAKHELMVETHGDVSDKDPRVYERAKILATEFPELQIYRRFHKEFERLEARKYQLESDLREVDRQFEWLHRRIKDSEATLPTKPGDRLAFLEASCPSPSRSKSLFDDDEEEE